MLPASWHLNDLKVVDVGEASDGGTLEITDHGELLYTPVRDFVGAETFAYTVANASGLTDIATVTVYVGVAPPRVAPPFRSDPIDEAVASLFVRGRPRVRERVADLATQPEGPSTPIDPTTGWTDVVDQAHEEQTVEAKRSSRGRTSVRDTIVSGDSPATGELSERHLARAIRPRFRS